MRKGMKVLLTVVVVLAMLTTSLCSVYAAPQGHEKQSGRWQQGESGNTYSVEISFVDVDEDFWAYKAILDLAKRGIINGYSDKTFKPNAKVTRSEFAQMLTKTLNLKATDNTQVFVDVTPSSWDYNAVEASKDYLTGYLTSSGKMYFYGSRNAVREDMAVALVKALNLTVESNNDQLQQLYKDYNQISTNLRDYVYTAYKNGLMIGSNGKFSPQGTLTRAEAATLLKRALDKTEKVPVDGNDNQKVVIGGSNTSGSLDTDATLSSLAVNGTAIAGFSAGTLSYNVVLPEGTTAVPTVTATVHDTGKATAVVTPAASLPGTTTVLVTAQDGTTKSTYVINFSVAVTPKDTDATLSSITINGTTLTGFSPTTLTYNVIFPVGTTAVPVVAATVNDAGKATSDITQATGLPGTATIVVTAQDGTTKKTYTINFTVAAP